ncbi:MAG: response regulator [Kofleriaceae bacterium]
MSTQILVIDDSATMRKLVEIAFRGADCGIEFASTGAQGIARASAVPPDVILLDFMLPDMKGSEVCAQLAKGKQTAQVGVVVMSGKTEVAEMFRESPNVVGFLPKPFTAEEVQARVRAALRHGDHASSRGDTTRIHTLVHVDDPVQEVPPSESSLELEGSLATVSLYEVLRLALASALTGVIALSSGEHVYLSDGAILLCTTTRPTDEFDQLAIRGGADLDSALAAARITQHQSGKPAIVTLAEAGFEIEVDLVAALKAYSYRLLSAAMALRAGQFGWREQRLPGYVESFGRPISLTAVALDHARGQSRNVPGGAEMLEHVYQRTARFSDAISGLRLTNAERAVLAAIDGASTLRQLGDRIKLPLRQVVATVSHLASVDLIVRADAIAGAGAGRALSPLIVHDLDAAFVEQLRALLARRPLAIPVLEVESVDALDAAVSRTKPQLILIGSDTHALPPELRALAKLTSATMVAVLEVADAHSTADTLALGYDAVLFKPVHITELERLLAL